MSGNDDGWVELAPGFYIVEESGVYRPRHRREAVKKQADLAYQEVREAFEGKIKFAKDGNDEAE